MDKPYFIAEMSGNHNGSIENAFKIIDAAKNSGADAVKIQTYSADSITLDCKDEEYLIKDENSLWNGYSLYDLYQKASTPYEWHEELFAYARKIGITLFSSPFDIPAIHFLEKFDCPILKIASFEAIDTNLVKAAAETGKPLIISTGVASLQEMAEFVDVALKNGCKDLSILHCVSSYPAPVENTNLATMQEIKRMFSKHPLIKVGLSDHSLGIGVSVAACALGAEVIEKHFVLDRSMGGVDSGFSMEPKEFAQMVAEGSKAAKAVGIPNFRISEGENKSQRQFSRSLIVVKDVKEGEVINDENMKSLRPGHGLHPRYYAQCIGAKFNKNMKKGQGLKLEDINFN